MTARTVEILRHRGPGSVSRRREWVVRRALVTADILGLAVAFTAAEYLYGRHPQGANHVSFTSEFIAFAVTLPAWVVLAKLQGLYDNDHERTNHSTADEI